MSANKFYQLDNVVLVDFGYILLCLRSNDSL